MIFLYDVELIPSYVRFTLVDLATSFSGALGLEHEESGEQVVHDTILSLHLLGFLELLLVRSVVSPVVSVYSSFGTFSIRGVDS